MSRRETGADAPVEVNPTITPATFTSKQFYAYLGVSEPTGLVILNRPDFYPGLRVGRRRLVNRVLLDRWLEEHAGRDLLA